MVQEESPRVARQGGEEGEDGRTRRLDKEYGWRSYAAPGLTLRACPRT